LIAFTVSSSCQAIVADIVEPHSWPPVGMGSGMTGIGSKMSAWTHSVYLQCGSQSSLQLLTNASFAGAFDMGPESPIPEFIVKSIKMMLDLLPPWLVDYAVRWGNDDDDSPCQGDGDWHHVLEKMIAIADFIHNAEAQFDKAMPHWDQHRKMTQIFATLVCHKERLRRLKSDALQARPMRHGPMYSTRNFHRLRNGAGRHHMVLR